jgi:hypothetical protein
MITAILAGSVQVTLERESKSTGYRAAYSCRRGTWNTILWPRAS